MSLLDQASLVITPNGYKEGILYSVIPNTTLGDMAVVRATTATRVNELGFIEEVGINVPRIDYSNGSCPSLLVEPQRTNLLTYSNDFSNKIWIKQSGTSVIPNNSISPEGLLNASKVISNGSNGIYQAPIAVSSSLNNTKSIYLKGVIGGETVLLRDAWRSINTISCTLTTEWQRFSLTEIQSGGEAGLWVKNIPLTGIYIYGSQCEVGSYPTSYIPTVASTVTRNADVIYKTGISSLIGQTEGTIFSNFYYSGNALGSLQIYPLYIGQGTFTDSVTIGLFENALLCRVFTDGVAQNYFTSSPLSIGNHKVAFVYANNNLKLFLNGVLIATDTSATIPNCSQVYIGSSGTTTMPEKININNNLIFKTVLTDQECINLTTL
jgi:hypothetical protein